MKQKEKWHFFGVGGLRSEADLNHALDTGFSEFTNTFKRK